MFGYPSARVVRGGGATLQTNSVDNTNQSILNLKNGNNMVLTPDAGGGVTFDATVAVQANGVAQTAEPAINFLLPISLADVPGVSTNVSIPGCVGVGGSHSTGLVPDPGAMVHSPHYYLDETCTWSSPTATAAVQNPLTSSGLSDSGSTLNVDVSTAFKGPSPWVDATRYGVRAVATNTTPYAVGLTANCTATTNTCLISNASTFVNGDGIAILGAGAANAMATPAAPTVIFALASGPTGAGQMVAGPTTGSTTYCVRAVSRDKGQGMTPAGSESCVTTAQATLGPQNASLTSCTKSGTTVTCTVAAEDLVAGAWVLVKGTSDDANFGGWFTVATAPSTTQFTYTTGLSTANGGTTSCTGGAVYWWQGLHVSIPTPDVAAWQDYFYVGASNAETRAGISLPLNLAYADDASSLFWDYYGSTMSGGIVWPAWVPTNYPTSATADTLVTTIASGAGTTTLTTADTVGTSVTGATIRFDNAPNLKAAYTAAAATGGEVFLPPISSSSNYYATNSFLNVTGPTLQAGSGLSWRYLAIFRILVWRPYPERHTECCPAIRARRTCSNLYWFCESRHLPDRWQLSWRLHRHQRECLYRDAEHFRDNSNVFENLSFSFGGANDYLGILYYRFNSQVSGGFGESWTNASFNVGQTADGFYCHATLHLQE